MTLRALFICSFIVGITLTISAQTTQPIDPQPAEPTTNPARQSAEEMLSQMLRPASQSARPLAPVPDGGGGITDRSTGASAVAPGAPQLNVLPEGSNIFDRIGRLSRTQSGAWELTLDSDGKPLKDPPLLVLPNKTLAQMEHALSNNDADLRFRVSGEITEYNGRNYVLIQRAPVIQRLSEPLR